MSDNIISSTQYIYDYKQSIIVFDENQFSYQILAWHSCCSISSEFNRQLIILIKENKTENNWLGTLTTRIENKILLWKNNLNQRQYQLYLSEQTDSIITHFEIQELSKDSLDIKSLILYTSSSYIILNNISCYQNPPINNHFITLKENNGIIYYLSDILDSNELLVFIFDQYNHYQLHHVILNENNQEIEFEHCCCCYLNNENKFLKSKFISCSHFLSFINMSCEIEQENDINKTNIHLDTHLID
jgi:hypothetical protein